jgi:3-oxo-5-alpha-steroid 4-dehydrogenase 1
MLLDPDLHRLVVGGIFAAAAVTALALLLVSAPYGRHVRAGWGPTVPNRLGWILMELPASAGFLAFYLLGEHRAEPAPLVLLGLWQLHYVHRTFIFPFRLRDDGKRMPALIVALAIVFNTPNAYANAVWVSHLGDFSASWLVDPRFIGGVCLFAAGMAINLHSDTVLLGLREPGEGGYKIPRGGLYRWVTCPNYLGEILEWLGWALASWSPAGLAFAAYTAANLAPRARTNHRWYLEKFPDYPPERRALIPGLW